MKEVNVITLHHKVVSVWTPAGTTVPHPIILVEALL